MQRAGRRRFLVAAGALAAAPLARAQKTKPGAPANRLHRVGVLVPMPKGPGEPYIASVRERLANHGFVDERNLRLVVQYAGGPWADVRELVASRPDAYLVCTTILSRTLHAAIGSAPMVFAGVADPVGAGLVRSLPRPGANVTGVANLWFELAEKRVELLHELVPSAKRVVVVAGVFDANLEIAMRRIQGVADRLGMRLFRAEARGRWTETLETSLQESADAVLVLTPFSLFGVRHKAEEVIRFSIAHRVPVMYADLESVDLGGLIFYGNSLPDDLVQAADLLARVLAGESPADIPVAQAARFELAVNLGTARAIGLEIPRSILLRADRVIG